MKKEKERGDDGQREKRRERSGRTDYEAEMGNNSQLNFMEI